jgi:hypothetical protein
MQSEDDGDVRLFRLIRRSTSVSKRDAVPFDPFDFNKQGRPKRCAVLSFGASARWAGQIYLIHIHGRIRARQATSVVAQKRTGISGFRCGLTGGNGFFEQMEKQQIPKIDPHRVGDTAGFRAKAAGPTLHKAVINGVSSSISRRMSTAVAMCFPKRRRR